MRTRENSYMDDSGWTWWVHPRAAPDIWIRYDGTGFDLCKNGEISFGYRPEDGPVYRFRCEGRSGWVQATNSPFFIGSSWYVFESRRYDTFEQLMAAVREAAATVKTTEAASHDG